MWNSWVTFSAPALRVPRTTLSASVMYLLAMVATLSGMVAENSNVCAESGTCDRMVSRSSMKPILSISSASSSTTTDAEGRFSLAVEAGSYNFRVQPPQGKGLPAFSILNKSVSGDIGGVLFQVPSARVLAGEVVDPTGRLLTSAKVSVYELVYDTDKTKRAELRASDITDKTGTFSLLLPATP